MLSGGNGPFALQYSIFLLTNHLFSFPDEKAHYFLNPDWVYFALNHLIVRLAQFHDLVLEKHLPVPQIKMNTLLVAFQMHFLEHFETGGKFVIRHFEIGTDLTD
jgi:hypothetical protein